MPVFQVDPRGVMESNPVPRVYLDDAPVPIGFDQLELVLVSPVGNSSVPIKLSFVYWVLLRVWYFLH